MKRGLLPNYAHCHLLIAFQLLLFIIFYIIYTSSFHLSFLSFIPLYNAFYGFVSDVCWKNVHGSTVYSFQHTKIWNRLILNWKLNWNLASVMAVTWTNVDIKHVSRPLGAESHTIITVHPNFISNTTEKWSLPTLGFGKGKETFFFLFLLLIFFNNLHPRRVKIIRLSL